MKISSQICQLLMQIIDQHRSNIAHSILTCELDSKQAKKLLENNYLTKGKSLETYWPAGEDREVDVFYREELKSFAYLADNATFQKVNKEDLQSYDINMDQIIEWLSKEFNILPSSKSLQNEYLDECLYFIGESQIQKKKIAIFFVRRLNDQSTFNKIEEFFIKESPTKLIKLILTSSNQFCPESLKTGVKIISIPKLLTYGKENALFNMDYVGNILFNNKTETKAYIHYSSGGILFVGDKSYEIGGDMQRQIIETMYDLYLKDSDNRTKWNTILEIANIETNSRAQDIFKKSTVSEVIANKNGYICFKTG